MDRAMTYKCTPWIPGNIAPMPDRPGLYQRKVGGERNRGIAWAFWNGNRWGSFGYIQAHAISTNCASPVQMDGPFLYPWRGIIQTDPNARAW